MDEKNNDLVEMYESIMKDYKPQDFVLNVWPMENGVYKQYSAYEKNSNSIMLPKIQTNG